MLKECKTFFKRKLDEKPLVIVYNSGKIQNELDENIEQFLEKESFYKEDVSTNKK